MRRSDFLPYPHVHNRRPVLGDSFAPVLAFVLAILAGLIVMLALLPAAVVLPAFGLWSLAAAAVVALAACLRPWTGAARAVLAWDMVGAVTLIGCAAAILGEIHMMADGVRPMSLRNESHD